jgi:cell pole-organizing protein PopZ
MSEEKSPPEPSMEDILASITRIIAEDKRAAGPPLMATGANDDVLDLTEAIEEDGTVRHLEPKLSPPTGDEPAEPKPPAEEAAEPKLVERIVSAATSQAAAAAFSELGSLPEPKREGDVPLGAGARTLEGIVRDALRPMLQAWLDEHLPTLVERLVRAEIARVVKEAELR